MSRKGHSGLYKAPTMKERRGGLRGEGDKIQFVDLRFEKEASCSIWERKKKARGFISCTFPWTNDDLRDGIGVVN